MSFVSPGVRLSHLKRHSLATVDVGSRLSKTGRRGSIPAFRGALTAAEAATMQELLERVQLAVIQLFQRKKLKENDLGELQENVRKLAETDAGPLLYDYYKDQLLKKGMVILRETVKNDRGHELLEKLSEMWELLFTDILPVLQAMLYPLSLPDDLSIRDVTLLEFRNIVLMKVSFEEAIMSAEVPLPPRITQMLLVLQGVKEGCWLSENFHKLERLLGSVVEPYLGVKGLYRPGPDPLLSTPSRPPPIITRTDVSEWVTREETVQRSERLEVPSSLLNYKRSTPRHSPLLHLNPRLATVLEHAHDTGRRHSLLS